MAVTASAHEPTRVAGDDAAAQLRAGLRAHGRLGRRERDEPVGERFGVARREARARSGSPSRNSFSAALLASTGTSQAAAS